MILVLQVVLLGLIRAKRFCVYSSEETINTEEQFMILSCWIHNTVNVASIKDSNVPVNETGVNSFGLKIVFRLCFLVYGVGNAFNMSLRRQCVLEGTLTVND